MPQSHPQAAPDSASGSTVRIRARGRSFLALVLSPERPLAAWLEGLDAQVTRSAGFFAGKPVILDFALLNADDADLAGLQSALIARGVRIIGIEGADRNWPALAGWDWPTSFEGGRASGALEIPDAPFEQPPTAPTLRASARIIDESIRSGQSVMHMDGDVIIIGSVASGAEIVAGGSIHVYGSLRGRAVAGVGGQMAARIFATKMYAELLAIDGYYMTADEMESAIAGDAAQALLHEDRIVVRKLH